MHEDEIEIGKKQSLPPKCRHFALRLPFCSSTDTGNAAPLEQTARRRDAAHEWLTVYHFAADGMRAKHPPNGKPSSQTVTLPCRIRSTTQHQPGRFVRRGRSGCAGVDAKWAHRRYVWMLGVSHSRRSMSLR